jgi:hypothetical protein
MACLEPDSDGRAGPPHPAASARTSGTFQPVARQTVILALILLYFLVVNRRSAWQAFMFTLNLDLCGTQIT